MLIRRLFVPAVVILLAITLTSLYIKTEEDKLKIYKTAVDQWRLKRDTFFLEHEHSPLSGLQKKKFEGISYYSIRPRYRIETPLIKLKKPEPIVLTTSKGKTQQYYKYAYVTAEIKKTLHTLYLYKSDLEDESGKLFMPFTDPTNGSTTYTSGRYLDIMTQPEDEIVVLDFNLAYHPYCAYNYHYNCPLPASENSISVPIKAGEKL